MKPNESNSIYYSVLLAFVLVIFMLVTFNDIVKKEYRPIYGEYTTELKIQLAGKDSLIRKDSLTIEQYTHKVDSLVKVVSDMQSHYHHDIDLMIYKTNQWLAFWLATIGIIVGFLSILNFVSRSRAKEEIESGLRDMKSDISSWKTNLEQNIARQANLTKEQMKIDLEGETRELKDEIKKQKGEINDNQKAIEEKQQQFNKELNKNKRENKINMLMASLCSFPDPQMFQSSSDKKVHIAYYMKEMLQQFETYLRENETAIQDGNYDIGIMIVILMNIKNAAFRCHPVYSSYHQNIPFDTFKKRVDNLTNDLIHGRVGLRELMGRINSVVDDLRELIYSIQ